MERRTFLKASAAASATLAMSSGPAFAANYTKKTAQVLGREMAYVDEGEGRPVVFLHGNPTSSYLWRGIIPHVAKTHRAIAPDLMGMGDSEKVAMAHTYWESANYLHTFLDSLDLEDAILVIHDWGSCLGWHYARTRSHRIAGICFMEAMAPPFMPIADYAQLGPFEEFLRTINTEGAGEKMIMEDNYFLDQFLKHGSPKGAIAEADMAEYNRYFPTAESRKILLDWPREIPIAGAPADVHAVVKANSEWLPGTTFPKLMFHVDPGAIIPMELAEALKGMLSNLDAVFLGPGGHFLQEDYPDEIGTGIAEWLQRV